MPKISVIMSVYSETQSQLSQAIESILKQSFHDFEYIIILDNPENKEAIITLENYKTQDSRIITIENETNIKLWASLNKWILVAKWKYIARMDGDDTCHPEKFEKQFNYLEKNPSIDLLFTWWEQVDSKGDIEIRIPKSEDFKNIKKTFFYKSPLLHASMMSKAEIFKKYQYPEIDRPDDVLEENLYSYMIDEEVTSRNYEKIKIFSENYLKILSRNTSRFYMNIYFWWMFLLIIIQWMLSRNKLIFWMFFEWLQRLYKKLFI